MYEYFIGILAGVSIWGIFLYYFLAIKKLQNEEKGVMEVLVITTVPVIILSWISVAFLTTIAIVHIVTKLFTRKKNDKMD